ncbi:hypothetical protein HOU03_gp420 [Caulobacter phage CcrSC]|uniref:Uncharacterized protein n=1 Tax=Caulobacter phage CcrSC TaxID=2283272 RepID=A0A385EG56_9CAUD|nr:hypothetical protein HOU03_gp420 [Caulobacter phage CcrSC]AXQ69848.1 hypothetical protein CcrSC_gp266c [Caulobacter phage CcrSC]
MAKATFVQEFMPGVPYRAVWMEPDYRRDPKSNHFCCRCQKDLKEGQPRRVVHTVGGGPYALHPDDTDLFAQVEPYPEPHDGWPRHGSDMGWFLIGADCAKMIGLEYTLAWDDPRNPYIQPRPNIWDQRGLLSNHY